MFNLIKNSKYDNFMERLLYAVYFIHQFAFIMTVSQLAHSVAVFDKLSKLVIIITFAIIMLIDLYYLLRGKYTGLEIFICLVIGIFFTISLYNYRDVMVFANIFAIFAFKNVDARRGLKMWLYATICGFLVNALLWILLGYTSNAVQVRHGVERIRYGLGFYYATLPAHYILSIVFVVILIIKEMKWYHYLSLAVISLVFYLLTDTKAAFYYAIAILIIHLVLTKLNNKVLDTILGIITILSFPLSFFAIYTLTTMYDANNKFMVFLNSIVSGRLSLGHKGMIACGFKLFGQNVGIWSGENATTVDYYIDSGMLTMLVLNGLIVLVICLAFMTFYSYLSARINYRALMIVLIFIALRSATDFGFMTLQLTPVVILFYDTLDKYNRRITYDG